MQLKLSTDRLDLGDGSRKGTFAITNTGQKPLSWQVMSGADWFTLSPTQGSLAARESQTVTVVAKELVEGDLAATISVQSNSGSGKIAVTANIVRPPRIAAWFVNTSNSRIDQTCVGDSVRVAANVEDANGLASVKHIFTWENGPQTGQGGPSNMILDSPPSIYHTGDIFIQSAGHWRFTVFATDRTGRTRTATAVAAILRPEGNRICGTFTLFRHEP